MGRIRRSLTQARSKNIPNQNLESVSFGPEELAGRAGLGTPFSPASLPSTKVREPSSAEYISMIRTAILLEKYLHGPGAPRGCAPDQLCKCIVHEIVC